MKKLFEKTDHEIDQFKEDIEFQSRYVWSEEDHILNDDSDRIENEWKSSRLKVVYKTFEKEYKSYVDKGIYFYGCPYEIYQSTFNGRMKEFLSRHDDYRLIDFIKLEFESGAFLFKRSYVSSEKMQKIQASLRKRYEFLVDRAREEKYNIILLEDDNVKIERILKNNLIEDEDLIEDNSDEFTTKQRIIALHSLGILEYLYSKPEINSVNRVAKAVRTFTGFNQGTVQSYINPIFHDYSDQSKSALHNEDDIKEVKKHLDDHVFIKDK